MNLQSLQNNLPSGGMTSGPITGMCIVSDPTKNPPGYEVVYRSHDKNEDCDLWKDSLFRSKITRYLCFTRIFPLDQGRLNNVLADIVINNEKDPVPNGFSLMLETVDSHEKATRKKQICVKMMPRETMNDAISDLIILSRSKRPPAGYTLVGEINGLLICFKMGPVPKTAPQTAQPLPSTYPRPAVPANGVTNQNLPYAVKPVNTPEHKPLTKQMSVLMPDKALAGVPFQLNSKYKDIKTLSNFQVPELHFRSLVDIENEYGYDFRIEKTAAARIPPDLQ